MADDNEAPEKDDDFKQEVGVLRTLAPMFGGNAIERLAHAFGLHELERVPDRYAAFPGRLAGTHEPELVANSRCEKRLWLAERERAGVLKLFRVLVFSSDTLLAA